MPTVPRGASSAGRLSRSKSSLFLNSKRFGALLRSAAGLPEPFSQRLPVMKRRPLPKELMVSSQLLEQRPQCALVCLTVRPSIASRERTVEVPSAPARSRARRAAP